VRHVPVLVEGGDAFSAHSLQHEILRMFHLLMCKGREVHRLHRVVPKLGVRRKQNGGFLKLQWRSFRLSRW
jgi:hypothetical protein